MDHETAKTLFSDHLDGELSAGDAEALRAHLAGCDTCRAEYEELAETMRSLSGLHHLPPPREFGQKVERRIHRRSRGRFFGAEPLLSRIPFEWVSFIVIVLLFAVYLFVSFDQKSRTITPAPAPQSDAATSAPTRDGGDPTSQPSGDGDGTNTAASDGGT